MSWYTSAKLWSFVGGVAAAGVATAVAGSKKCRQAAVAVVAKGMQVQQNASEGLQSIKDDASDLAEEARQQAKIDAARADRRAAIEARVREQVEAEFAAEEEKAEAEAKKAEAEQAEKEAK